MKHVYFLATEALAGLLCDARLDHTYRPLPGRALDKAGQVRDADSGIAPVERSVGPVDVVGRPLDVALIPLNLIGCGNDINGHKSGGHSVVPAFVAERVKGASAKRHGQSAAEQNGVEEVNNSGPCSCGGGSAQRVEPVQLALFGLRHADQSLPYGEARIGDTPLGKLVDGGLLTPALDRHLQLSDAVRFEVSDDLLPVHTHENNCIQLLRQAVFS